MDGLSALDPGGNTNRLAGHVQRRYLFSRLVGSMLVVMPRVLGQDLPKVLFAVDHQVQVTTQSSIERHRPSGRPAGVRSRRRAGLACQRS
jgi:hypothetical protein